MADSVWPLVHTERRALAADLAAVRGDGWTTPSLCAGWTVHEVLAHQVKTAKLTPPAFVTALIRSRFSFTRLASNGVAEESRGGPGATLAAFREVIDAATSPPGPRDSWLGEAIVHSEDIRRPLGLRRDYPIASVVRVLDFYKGSNALIGTKRRIEGLTLIATDTTWSHGSGLVIEGPALSLLMAATGRTAHFDDLVGPGLAMLRG